MAIIAMATLPAYPPSPSPSTAAEKDLLASCFSGIPLPSYLHLNPHPFDVKKRSSIAVVATQVETVQQQQQRQQPEQERAQVHLGGTGAGAETKWKKKMVPYSRRPNFQYFSGHVKKHRHLPPRNPSHQLGKKHGVNDQNAQRNVTSMMKIIQKLHCISEVKESGKAEVPIPEEEEENADDGALLPRGECTAGKLCLPKPHTNLFSLGSFWSTVEDNDTQGFFPWELSPRAEEKVEEEERIQGKLDAPSLADLVLPPRQLKRLRTLGIPLQKAVKIGRLGVTKNIVQSIVQRWRHSELVKVKCQGPAAENMLKIHRDLEWKTGGLVIWRSGSVAVVYRGSDFDTVHNTSNGLERLEGLLTQSKICKSTNAGPHESSGTMLDLEGTSNVETDDEGVLLGSNGTEIGPHFEPDAMHKKLTESKQSRDAASYEGNVLGIVSHLSTLNIRPNPFTEREHEMEIEDILESVGLRYKGWEEEGGMQPIPVDADLLPSEIPGYRPPYRLLPYGVEPKLTNHEQTKLRRFIRNISPHFASGRNTGLQGLAAGILKLWEKSEVVKIAMKKNVQNMDNKMMAEELKQLTGGDLLARDKYFITLYRGKDFLPRQVASALTERLVMLSTEKVEENVLKNDKGIRIHRNKTVALGKHGETENMVSVERKDMDSRHLLLMHSLEAKLAMAMRKKEKAQQEWKNLEDMFMPLNQHTETEIITEEERCVLRERGLEMSAFLLLGKRGVFDAVIKNIHLHWKHMELIKVLVKEIEQEELQRIARILEYASGGVLVAIVSTSMGQAIIMYRGKDYERRRSWQPQHLLTRKEASKRSLEIQHCMVLSKHIQALENEIRQQKMALQGAGKLKDENIEEQGGTLQSHVRSGFIFDSDGCESVDSNSCLRNSMNYSDMEVAENDHDSDNETDNTDAEDNYFSQLFDTNRESTNQDYDGLKGPLVTMSCVD